MREHYPVKMDYFVRRATFCGWKVERRLITNYELVYVLSGEGQATLQGQHFLLHPGDLLFIRPGESSSFAVHCEPCMVFYALHFTPLQDTALPLPSLMQFAFSHRLELLFRELHQVRLQEDPARAWRENLLTEQLLCEIWELLQQQNSPAQQNRIRKVLQHIHVSDGKNLPLEELCQLCGVRKTVFLQEFKAVTGTTPQRYISARRMEYAKELLRETDAPIAQIARECGYEDAFYFSRCFKKYAQRSPRAFRKDE